MEKLCDLKEYIKGLNKVVVAYSGGVDSTFLLKVAFDTLGENASAVTITSDLQSKKEIEGCVNFCKKNGIKHELLVFDPFRTNGFVENPKDRCYLCKKEIFSQIKSKAGDAAVLEGSNKDDGKDYRPGLRAIDELKIESPLRKFGFTKDEIREYSRLLGLETHNKPSLACLASRIPYNEEITKEKLSMIEKSENFLSELGLSQIRVRCHGNLARVEILENEFDKFISNRKEIIKHLKEYGFLYITLDIGGYRIGSLNEALD